MNLNYSINGISFLSLGIIVSDSSGVIDGLELKEPFSVNWPDAHGQVVDLLRPRYKEREIELDCKLIASSPDDLITKTNGLIAQLVKTGTQRLRINPVENKPLVYEVYSPKGFSVKKKWRDATIPAEFSLTLIEPQPVKWILSGVTGQVASIRLTSPAPLVIYWGDGTKTDAKGTNQTYSHTYGGTTGTVYYVIVSGELERMTVHQKTNLTEIWPLLY
jgi:hypothetical protein